MSRHLLVSGSAIAIVLLLAQSALGDVPKPPGWEEGCTAEKQQRPGEHCLPCWGTLSGRPACADELQSQGYSHRCTTERSGVAYTMLFCKTGAAPTPTTAPTTAPPTAPSTSATSSGKPSAPLDPTATGPTAPTSTTPSTAPAAPVTGPATDPPPATPAPRACGCIVGRPDRIAPALGLGAVLGALGLGLRQVTRPRRKPARPRER